MSVSHAICLLAGGQARRMGGGDKGEIVIEGKTIISTLVSRFASFDYMFLNANGDLDRFQSYGLNTVPDKIPDYQGPLSGIYSAMCHLAETKPDIKWLISLPTDAPLIPASLPEDLLLEAINANADVVSVQSHGRTHPVVAAWSMRLLEPLREALIEKKMRKIDLFTASYNCKYISYDEHPDPFLNLNRPEDLEAFHAHSKNK